MPKTAAGLAPIAPLYEALVKKLIPWAEQWGAERVLVAQHDYQSISQSTLPHGIEVSKRKLPTSLPTPLGVREYNYTVPTEHFPTVGMQIMPLPVITTVLSGQAQLEAGDYFIDCEPGSFIIVPPGVPQTDGMRPHLKSWQDNQGATDLFWLHYWKEGILCHICHSCGAKHQSPSTHEKCFVQSRQVMLCLEAMTEEMSRQKAGDPQVYRSLLLSLLTILRRELETGNYIQSGGAVSDFPSLTTGKDPILRAVQYMRFHLNEKLTIEGMARRQFMSRSQFTRQFRSTMGVSFLSYLNEQRLLKVETLLQTTDWSLDAICDLSGLKVSNLHKLFRNRTGMSPLEYREKIREEQ